MKHQQQILGRLGLSLAAVLMLYGCNGGSTTSSSTPNTASTQIGTEQQASLSALSASQFGIDVYVSNGLTGASCRLLDKNGNPITKDVVSDGGNADFGQVVLPQIVVAECSGGVYDDVANDADGKLDAKASLHSVMVFDSPPTNTEHTMVISELTEMAYILSKAGAGLASFDRYLDTLATHLGLPADEYNTLVPAEDAASAQNNAAGQYAVLLAGLSYYSRGLGQGTSLNQAVETFLASYALGVLSDDAKTTLKRSLQTAAQEGTASKQVTADLLARIGPHIAGDLRGLPSGKSMTLANSDGQKIVLSGDGHFVFPALQKEGAPYAVSVEEQALAAQCKVNGGQGVIQGDASVLVVCTEKLPLPARLERASKLISRADDTGSTTSASERLVGVMTALAVRSKQALAALPAAIVDTLIPTAEAKAKAKNKKPHTRKAKQAKRKLKRAITPAYVPPPLLPAPVPPPPPPPTTLSYYSVGGSVSGLASGESIIVKANAQSKTVTANGKFTFDNLVPGNGDRNYSVNVNRLPVGKNCAVTNGWGTASGLSHVTNVAIECVASPIREIDVVQTVSQAAYPQRNVLAPFGIVPNPSYQLLVAGRSALIRAYVYQSGSFNGPVKISVNDKVAVNMTCPANLPTDTGVTIPIYSYQLAEHCYYPIAAADVKAGMKLTISAGSFTRTVSPAVNTKTTLSLVVFPITASYGGVTYTGKMPSVASLKAEMLKKLPLRDVSITVRAALNVGNVANGTWNYTDFSNVLGLVADLQETEAPNKIYVGFIPTKFADGIAGMATLGDIQSPWSRALINDTDTLPDPGRGERGHMLTFIHELGHVLGLDHTSCASTLYPEYGNPDLAGYWTGSELANLSPAALYDGVNLINPNGQYFSDGPFTEFGKDIMAPLCSGWWFNEYQYNAIGQFIRDMKAPMAAVPSALSGLGGAVQPTMLRIRGTLHLADTDLVKIKLVKRVSGGILQESPNRGDYELRIKTTSGQVISRYFNVQPFSDVPDDEPDGGLFAVNLPDPGPISSITVYQNGVAISTTIAP